MCVCPIKIKNNSLDFVAGRDEDFFYVPCGHCKECRDLKRSDYVFRLISEKLTTNCYVYYYTLTFNNCHLPYIEVPPLENINYYRVYNCFDKKLVQKFIKRLRKYLSNELSVNLRYFLTSEFGELEKRPHHHVLFYLDKYIDPHLFRKIITYFWSEPTLDKYPKFDNFKNADEVLQYLVKDKSKPNNSDGYNTRSYGFNKPGDYMGVVSDYRPLQYVAKYVAKDLAFYNYFPDVKKYKELYCTGTNIYTFDYSVLKNALPFTLMSINFGVKIIDKFTFQNLVDNKYDVVQSTTDGVPKVMSYRIPMYFIKKIMYIRGLNNNGSMHYMLNKLGYDVRLAQLKNRIYNTYVEMLDVCNYIKSKPFNIHLPYSTDDLIFMFSNMSSDEIKLIGEYKYFYRNKLKCDFQLDFDKDFDYFRKSQTKFRKASYLFEPKYVYELSFDVTILEEICKIMDYVSQRIKIDQCYEKLNDEQIFKRLYYGEKYFSESEEKVL